MGTPKKGRSYEEQKALYEKILMLEKHGVAQELIAQRLGMTVGNLRRIKRDFLRVA